MSTADEIIRLQGAKTNIKAKLNALNDENHQITDETLDEYPPFFDTIPTGGGATPEDVKFIDYDGTILHSYSADDFANLTELPANPTHTGLTSQGWNWNLTDAKNYVASYGKLIIGQMYVTDDNKTRIYIHLEEGRLNPSLCFAINGTATIDWGDNTTSTVTGTSTYQRDSVYAPHTYTTAGDYVISIESSADIYISGNNDDSGEYGSYLLVNQQMTNKASYPYRSAIYKIELSSNVRLGFYAFCACYSLKSITIPNNLPSISQYIFKSCCNLKSITLPNNMKTISASLFSGCSVLTNISLPNNITQLDSNSFNGCYLLSNITIPNSVTSIGDNAFAACYNLTAITIPNSVTKIGNYVFSNCKLLTNIVIPENVTSIGYSVFYSCTGLFNVILPNNITSIKTSMFQECYSLTNIVIPENVTSIDNSAFYNCIALTNIVIPENVTSIGNGAFYNCKPLTSIIIPEGVTSIGTSVFYNCKSLASITIPEGITSIGNGTFRGCIGMGFYDFTALSTIPTLANINAFTDIPSDCKIIVPDDLYEDWIVAQNWSTYASYIIKESEV